MQTDVLVIGGGATGAGIAWDLTLRGLRVVLVEMGDLATGTSGRYHGLLHSGGRYAVRDPESAVECIDENRILRRIAPHALEDTSGFFILVPGDGEEYVDQWIAACAACHIPADEISIAAARKREPAIHPGVRRVFEVPDGTCDSWDMLHALQRAAEGEGATFLTYHRLDEFIIEDGKIVGARVTNLRVNESFNIEASVCVNAAGPWAAQIAAKAGVHFNMRLSRGAMLAFNVRWVNTVINRLRAPGDGDIFVPVGTVSVTGTTSVPTDDPGDNRVEPWEVQRVLGETELMTPGISRARVLRAWGGVRPLYDPHAGEGREARRTFDVVDHEADGAPGLISILGGKLTTFRLMAERTSDAVCARLGVTAACTTTTTLLPAIEGHPNPHFHTLDSRLSKLEHGATPGPLICECELVTEPQIAAALAAGDVVTLHDLRRDLRLGMGPCQGGFCAYRAAALRHELVGDTPQHTGELLSEFVERRFGGVKPLLWSANLRQALLAEHIYGRILGLTQQQPAQPEPIKPLAALPRRIDAQSSAPRVVVIGAGLAGLTAALAAVDAGAKVEIVAFGQGALTLHPGWIELGDVAALTQIDGHPYQLAAESLAAGLALIKGVVPLTSAPSSGVVTALGRFRPVSYAASGALHALKPGEKVAIIGIVDWRDFYAQMIADSLRAAGYDAVSFDIFLGERKGNFDAWTVDLANALDTPEGLTLLLDEVRGELPGDVTAVGFPAILGFKPETRARIAAELGLPVFEIPTLTPSIPGLRLYHALRTALLDRGARFSMGTRVIGLESAGGRVTGVQAQTASNRPRVIPADAVILASGGLYGGGIDSDYQGTLRETIAGLPVTRKPDGAWFAREFLSGEPQPIHLAGVRTDTRLRPLSADGAPLASNLFAAGRLLGGYSPVAQGCTEGVDIATGAHAALQVMQALTRGESL